MKTRIIIFNSTVAFLLLSILSCNGNQQNSSEQQIIQMLKSFYTHYITESAQMTSNNEKINSIKKEFCTVDLLNRIEKEKFEYDPFLNAQDSNTEWLKTLSIKKDTKRNSLYYVSYLDSYNNTKITISLIIKKVGENYKIDSIL